MIPNHVLKMWLRKDSKESTDMAGSGICFHFQSFESCWSFGEWGLFVGWLVGSAPDIRALGQRVQTEISELGTKIPKLPQTSNRHNKTVFPRIKQQSTEGKIGY